MKKVSIIIGACEIICIRYYIYNIYYEYYMEKFQE